MDTIRVALSNGYLVELPVLESYGALAIHQDIHDDHAYTLSHAPTGFSVRRHCHCLPLLSEMMQALVERTGIDWDVITDEGMTRKQKKRSQAILALYKDRDDEV